MGVRFKLSKISLLLKVYVLFTLYGALVIVFY